MSFFSPERELYPPLPFAPDTPPHEIWGTLYNKFYDWKYHECRSVLDGLKAYPADDDDQDDPIEARKWPTPRESGRSMGILTEYFDIFTYNDDGEEIDATRIEAIDEDDPSDRRRIRNWAPNPRYTICTPLNSNMPNTSDIDKAVLTLPFSCYSDDPAFDMHKHHALQDCFAWQTDFWDPDHEIIQLETVRLLHFQQGFTPQEIDGLKLPTFPRVRSSCVEGLIWQGSQRDIPSWPDSRLSAWGQLTLRDVASLYSTTGRDVFSQVQYGSTIFCPNLGCLSSSSQNCETHRVPGIREREPSILSTEYEAGDYCSDRCFQRLTHGMIDEETLDALVWPEGTDELESVQGVLKLAPDASPCDLAIICRLSCEQVFANRRKLYPDQDILEERAADPVPDRRPLEYRDIPVERPLSEDQPDVMKSVFERQPPPPCSHAGPCRRNVCSCFDEGYHCERDCRCGAKCSNRWRGCKCKHSKHHAKASGLKGSCAWLYPEGTISTCPCANAWRECDPEVCVGCVRKGSKCLNRGVQESKFARYEVNRSQWGYGAFAVGDIPQGTWIGDYVGDIEYTDTASPQADATEMVRAHTGLNYSFEVSKGVAIDSMVAGNPTRFLNHSSDNNNCAAHILKIHNTLHVVLYADRSIGSGQELLLDYGEDYWKGHKDPI